MYKSVVTTVKKMDAQNRRNNKKYQKTKVEKKKSQNESCLKLPDLGGGGRVHRQTTGPGRMTSQSEMMRNI